MIDFCPNCKVSLVGDPIPENIRKYYSPPYYWRREIAIYDIRLDRTIRYRCPDCGFEWKRSYDKEALYEVAKQVCHEAGIDWYDPRTGECHRAPKRVLTPEELKKLYNKACKSPNKN